MEAAESTPNPELSTEVSTDSTVNLQVDLQPETEVAIDSAMNPPVKNQPEATLLINSAETRALRANSQPNMTMPRKLPLRIQLNMVPSIPVPTTESSSSSAAPVTSSASAVSAASAAALASGVSSSSTASVVVSTKEGVNGKAASHDTTNSPVKPVLNPLMTFPFNLHPKLVPPTKTVSTEEPKDDKASQAPPDEGNVEADAKADAKAEEVDDSETDSDADEPEVVTALQEQVESLPLAELPQNRPLTIRQVCFDFPVFTIENFLSPTECQALIKLGEPTLKQSTAVENDKLVIRKYRNSWTGFISQSGKPSTHPIVNRVLTQVSVLSGYPIEHLESINIVRYRPGEQYKAHFDSFEPDNVNIMGREGQRIMTFFVYLNDVPEECGGATYFPNVNLRVQPKVGSCTVWFNTDPTGKLRYPKSFHGGQKIRATPNYPNPVKYALNIWVRQNCHCCGKPL